MTQMMRSAGLFAFLSLFMAGQAAAATCTSKASGSWASAATWTCTGTPVVTIPTATDTAIIASPNTVTLVGSVPVTNLTVNSGGTLNVAFFTLTVSGNLTNNGNISGTAGSGQIGLTGNAAVVSGTGTISNTYLYFSGTGPSIAAGAVQTFGGSSRLYAGRTSGGATVTGSVLTISGTINSTVAAATTTFLRFYANSTVIGSSGAISGSTSAAAYYTSTAAVTNNGSVTLQQITRNATSNVWTQGTNSSLTLSAATTVGTLNASATGNTVTYNGTSTVIAPSAAGYWNLAGTIFPGACPVAYTISGTSPCLLGPVSVTRSPGTCVDDATLGATVWGGLTNVGSSDNLYATTTTAATVGTKLTHYLKCTNYGFAIPAGATINGIAVGVERNISSTSRTTARDNAMRLVKAGVIGTTDRSSATTYTATDVAVAHGGTADLWGGAWTPADINLSTFGAAFSASVATTRANARTVSVDHMPITVTYTEAAAPHHIRIEHSGAGQTCASEQLTVKACANAACTSNFTAAAVSGNVTWAGSPGGSVPFSLAAGGSGQVTVSLAVSTAQTVTLGTSGISPTPTAASDCVNLSGGTSCSLPFAAATQCRDAVEVGASAGTSLYTKLAGVPFSLDIVSANYTGTIQVELVNAATGSCATFPQLTTQNVAFSNQSRKTVTFTSPKAARVARVRMTGSASPSCSGDAFAIRPTDISVTSTTANADDAGANVAATPSLKAGSAFTLTATAVAGYDGTPVVDADLVSAHSGAVTPGVVAGSFAVNDPVTGTVVGDTFTYSEVGYFRFGVNGVKDTTFANVDALETTPECTPDYSNTPVGGKYGCYFGNTAATVYFGRFVPDHFAVVPGAVANRSDWCGADGLLVSDGATPCVAPAFTYMGEQMEVEFILEAETVGNTVTQNYDGVYAKLDPLAANNTLMFGAVNGATSTSLTSRLDVSLVSASGSGSFVNGVANIVVPLAITRGASEDGPYADLSLGIAPVDSDNVATILDLDTAGDAASDRTQVNSAVTAVRYGRTKLSNAHGSELLALPLTATAEYWDGADWVVSADDNETSLTLNASNYQYKTGGAWVVAPPANATVTAGILNYTLSSGSGTGSVDISVSLPTYLPGNTARATFGVYKGNREFIYLRENY